MCNKSKPAYPFGPASNGIDAVGGFVWLQLIRWNFSEMMVKSHPNTHQVRAQQRQTDQ